MTKALPLISLAVVVICVALLYLRAGALAGDVPAAGPRVIVDPSGRQGPCADSRSAAVAGHAATPWCTVSRALEAAPDGATILLRGGSYPDVLAADVPERDRGATIRPYGGERVRLASFALRSVTDVRLEGLAFAGPVTVLARARGVTIARSRLASGMTIEEGSSRIRVIGNRISNPRGNAIIFASSGTPITGVVISGNSFHDIGVAAINVRNFRDVRIERNRFTRVVRFKPSQHTDVIRTFGGGRGLVIRRNLLHDNAAIGIFFKDGAVSDATIENNVIVRTLGGFYGVALYDTTGLRMTNNTIVDNTAGVVFQRRVTDAVVFNNILQSLNLLRSSTLKFEDFNYVGRRNQGTRGAHDVRRAPRFVDRRRLNYRLAPGSPGIDAGRRSGAPDRDRLGHRRRGRRPDLGAHEYAPLKRR